MKLTNIIVVTTPETYDIKDSDEKIVGHIYGQHDQDFYRDRCEICHIKLAKATNYCPSCSASKLPDMYIIEGTDGTPQGEIHLNRLMGQSIFGFDVATIARNLGGYVIPKIEIYDAEQQLRAYLINHARWGQTESVRIYNPNGENIARIFLKFHRETPPHSYEVLTPARSVVAQIRKEEGSHKYYIHSSPDALDPSAILNYVVALDIMMRAITNRRLLPDGD